MAAPDVYVSLTDAPVPRQISTPAPSASSASSAKPKGPIYVGLDDTPAPPTPRAQPSSKTVAPPSAPTPQSAGHNWLDAATQFAEGVKGGMTGTFWNAVGSIPNQNAQQFAEEKAKAAGSLGSPTGRAFGKAAAESLPLLALPEIEGPLWLRALAQAGIGWVSSYLTAPQGEKTQAAEVGAAAGGVLTGAGAGLAKWFGGKAATPAVERAVQEAKDQGYKLMPSAALGFGKGAQEFFNAGKGAAAEHNYNLYEQTLAELAGIPKGVKIDSDSLAQANKAIANEFASKLAGKTVKIPATTAAAVRSLVEKQPAIAEEVVGVAGLSKALAAAEAGKPIPAKDWFALVRQLKAMRYAQKEPNVRFQLSSVIGALEQPVKRLSPDINKAYQTFNSQYRANALLLDATANDLKFLQTGKINPVKVWAAAMRDAKTTSAQAEKLITNDPLTQTVRRAAQLDLVPQAREVGDAEMMNLLLAGAHSAGAPVHLSLGSFNVLPKMGATMGFGAAGRALYGTPMGQRLLESGRMVDPLIGKLFRVGVQEGLVNTLPGEFPSTFSYDPSPAPSK